MIQNRIWKIGTRRRVRIRSVRGVRGPRGGVFIIVCDHLDAGAEMTVCVLSAAAFEAIEPRPTQGTMRTIEFAPGGRFGGRWTVNAEGGVRNAE